MDDSVPVNSMLLTLCIVILVFILLTYTLLNAFYVAIGQLSEAQTREKAEQNNKKAKKLLKYLESENKELDRVAELKSFLALLLSGISVLAFQNSLSKLIFKGIENLGLNLPMLSMLLSALAIVLATAFVLFIFGEVFAKIIGIMHPNNTAGRLINFVGFVIATAKPSFVILNFIWEKSSNAFGTNPDFDEEVTEEGILQMVDDAEESGVLLESQKEIINNIFEFDDIDVGDVMNHRTDIVAVDASEKIEDALKIAVEKGFSRIPVFDGDVDDIIGIIYVKDMLKYVGKKIPERITIRSVMREAYHIPQTKRCSELFKEFTEKRIQMAIVIDEYGGTAGIVTLEDLVESVMGNIQDEYDNEQEEISKVNETTFKIDGTCDIEEVEDMLGISFPDGDYDTLGGFMLYSLGRIPKDDEKPTIEQKGYRFTAEAIKERRIEVVKAEKLPDNIENSDENQDK